MRAHLYLPITDGDGHVILDVEVRLLQPGTTTLIDDTLYTAATGTTVVAQPFVSSNGVIDVYADLPQRVRVGVTPPGQTEFYLEDVDIEPDASTVVTATAPLRITNQPTSAGKVLQSIDSNTSQWGDEQAGDVVVDPTGLTHITHTRLQPALADLDAAIGVGGGGGAVPTERAVLRAITKTDSTALGGDFEFETSSGSGVLNIVDQTTGFPAMTLNFGPEVSEPGLYDINVIFVAYCQGSPDSPSNVQMHTRVALLINSSPNADRAPAAVQSSPFVDAAGGADGEAAAPWICEGVVTTSARVLATEALDILVQPSWSPPSGFFNGGTFSLDATLIITKLP